MPDYRKLYYNLMGELETTIRALIVAQQRCEAELLQMGEEEDAEEAAKDAENRRPPPPPPPIQLFPDRTENR